MLRVHELDGRKCFDCDGVVITTSTVTDDYSKSKYGERRVVDDGLYYCVNKLVITEVEPVEKSLSTQAEYPTKNFGKDLDRIEPHVKWVNGARHLKPVVHESDELWRWVVRRAREINEGRC